MRCILIAVSLAVLRRALHRLAGQNRDDSFANSARRPSQRLAVFLLSWPFVSHEQRGNYLGEEHQPYQGKAETRQDVAGIVDTQVHAANTDHGDYGAERDDKKHATNMVFRIATQTR